MRVTQNIGIINALIRITCGITIVAICTAKLTKKPWCNSYIFMIIMGAMKVAEGIVRYCPITDLFQKGQGMMENDKPAQNDNHDAEHKSPANPPSIPPELADSLKSVLE